MKKAQTKNALKKATVMATTTSNGAGISTYARPTVMPVRIINAIPTAQSCPAVDT